MEEIILEEKELKMKKNKDENFQLLFKISADFKF